MPFRLGEFRFTIVGACCLQVRFHSGVFFKICLTTLSCKQIGRVLSKKPKKKASRLITEKRFWSIVEGSLDGTSSVGLTWERQYAKLTELLSKLTDSELVGFRYHEDKFFYRACRQELWAVGHIVTGGMFSNDSFMDFRTWLIYRGENVYKSALRNHESLVSEFDKIPYGEMPIYEQYPVLEVFDARHGDGSFNKTVEQYQFPTASPSERKLHFTWHDLDSLRELCPQTFDAYWDSRKFS